MPNPDATGTPGDRIEAALEEFRRAWLDGERPDPEEFCRSRPECGAQLADRIRAFIYVAEGLGEMADSPEEAPGDGRSKGHENLAGTTLGDFKIIGMIGRGGMGTVYEAEQISLGRAVALKVLPIHLSLSDLSVQKFHREAAAGGRQSHPGIVAVHAVGEDKGRHFIAQELVPGGQTLADRIENLRKRSVQPPGHYREVAALFLRIAVAVDHAHQTGVIHRDIKPSNILLTGEGEPKVTDFGLAKIEDALHLTRSGEFAGTPYYMSPEQALRRRKRIDKRTDIFSLGVTLYEMLALHRPFEGKTTHEVIAQIIAGSPRDPRRLNTRIPRDLAVICLKAMERDPADRYSTMREFADDLERFHHGDVIHAKPTGPGARFVKWVKRNPVASTASGMALAAVLVFATVVPWVIAQKEKHNALLLKKERDTIEKNLEQIRRLSDVKRLSDLEVSAEALWPAYPKNIEKLQQWIDQADRLIGRLDIHRRTVATLRENALPLRKSDLETMSEIHPKWKTLSSLRATKSSLEKQAAMIKAGKKLGTTGSGDQSTGQPLPVPEELTKQLAALEVRVSDLDRIVSERWIYEFEDTEMQWQHDLLSGLVSGLEYFSSKKDGLYAKVRERLAFAESVEESSITAHDNAWEEAIASIANRKVCPQYDGLVIDRMIGFVPIGTDPDSGLWEFCNLQTGTIPQRGQDGKIVLTEKMGLVFVLIPGGSFTMGACKPSSDRPLGSPNVDPEVQHDESFLQQVTIQPFLLSKFEMTQGQWLRFTGKNPCAFIPWYNIGGKIIDLLHPVEYVTWEECADVVRKLNLRLPTEAEWEYACRAGTTTVFWTGDDKKTLDGTANLMDFTLMADQNTSDPQFEQWLKDGHAVHAPVGSYSANPFGLHDIHGNVFEWCQDVYYTSYDLTPNDGTANYDGSFARIYRGGAWNANAFNCRSANRDQFGPTDRDRGLGLRPASSLITY